jgi:hypothetical protein
MRTADQIREDISNLFESINTSWRDLSKFNTTRAERLESRLHVAWASAELAELYAELDQVESKNA